MNDLYTELQNKTNDLDVSIKALRMTGTEYAQAERDYKVLLRTECLKLKSEGMSVGLIELTCYGVPDVADARFKRDVAEAKYRANQEAINALKLQMRLIESQIQREWGAAGDI